jgi:hypothetical protein
MASLSNIPSTPSKFYKNPVLYVFLLYTVTVTCVYMFYSGTKSFIFGKNTNLSLVDLLSYPYGLSSPTAIIKSFVSNPIQLFGLLFTLLLPNLVNVTESTYTPYFYGVALAIIMIIILFIIHVTVVRLVIDPKTIVISDKFKVDKKTDESYNNIYRGHWITLFTLAPIYALIQVYVNKKIS